MHDTILDYHAIFDIVNIFYSNHIFISLFYLYSCTQGLRSRTISRFYKLDAGCWGGWRWVPWQSIDTVFSKPLTQRARKRLKKTSRDPHRTNQRIYGMERRVCVVRGLLNGSTVYHTSTSPQCWNRFSFSKIKMYKEILMNNAVHMCGLAMKYWKL